MKIIVFDCESNGLHGEIFAIGAVCVEDDDYSTFQGVAPYPEPLDEWVAEHVIPHLGEMPKYESALALRNAFWQWLQRNKPNALIVADFGVPVEARLLADCQKDDPSREWDHPYPLHELGTLLLAAGVNPDISREEFADYKRPNAPKHNPLHDAQIAVVCWQKALKRIHKTVS
jgi:hypothetical protein